MLLCMSCTYALTAQTVEKQKEVGIVFSNLDQFGLTYKTGTSNALWRFTLLGLSGANNEYSGESEDSDQNRMSVALRGGREYRKALAEKLEMRYGADLSLSYAFSVEDNEITDYNYTKTYNNNSYSAGIYFVFGFNYVINNQIVIGAELSPYVQYAHSTSEINYDDDTREDYSNNSSYINYGLSSGSAQLSLAYRF